MSKDIEITEHIITEDAMAATEVESKTQYKRVTIQMMGKIKGLEEQLARAEKAISGFQRYCIKPECECWACVYFKEKEKVKK